MRESSLWRQRVHSETRHGGALRSTAYALATMVPRHQPHLSINVWLSHDHQEGLSTTGMRCWVSEQMKQIIGNAEALIVMQCICTVWLCHRQCMQPLLSFT